MTDLPNIERQFDDLAQWYIHNKARMVSLDQKMKFLEKAMDCTLTLQGHMLQELQRVQQRPTAGLPRIWTPDGASFRGATDRVA